VEVVCKGEDTELVAALNVDTLTELRHVRAQPMVRLFAGTGESQQRRFGSPRKSEEGARSSMQSLFRAVGGRTRSDNEKQGEFMPAASANAAQGGNAAEKQSETGGLATTSASAMKVADGADEGKLDDSADPVEKRYLVPYDPERTDAENTEARQRDRHPLLQLFPGASVKRRKQPRYTPIGKRPTAGAQVLVTARQLAFELEGVMEPFYCSLTLYNVAKRERASETFVFDLNSPEQLSMVALDEKVPPSQPNPSAVFTVAQPNTDLYLVLRIDKVLQGDTESVAEPYIKAATLKEKDRRKASMNVSDVCLRLGRYRQGFAWGMLPLFDDSGAVSPELFQEVISVQPLYRMRTQDTGDASFLQGVAEMHASRTGTTSRRLKVVPGHLSLTVRDLTKQRGPIDLPRRFTSTGLRVDPAYNPYGDALAEALSSSSRGGADVPAAATGSSASKSASASSDLSEQGRLVHEPLREAGLVLEMDPFGAPPDLVPQSEYVHTLFVHPDAVSLGGRSGSRNVGIRVFFLEQEPEAGLSLAEVARLSEERPASAPLRLVDRGERKLVWTLDSTITYHSKSPQFCSEFKLFLPVGLRPEHHLVFLFYHISAKKPKPMAPVKKETPLGFSVLPLLRFVPLLPASTEGELVGAALSEVPEPTLLDEKQVAVPLAREHHLAVALELPPGYVEAQREYHEKVRRVAAAIAASPSNKEVAALSKEIAQPPPCSGVRYLDGGKPLFRVRAHLLSTLTDQTPEVCRALQHYSAAYTHGEEAASQAALQAWLSVPAEQLVRRLPFFLNDMLQRLRAPLLPSHAGEIFRALLTALDNADDHCRRLNRDLGQMLGSFVQYTFDPSAAVCTADGASLSDGKKGGGSKKSSEKGRGSSSSSSSSKFKSKKDEEPNTLSLAHLLCEVWVAEIRRRAGVGELQIKFSSFLCGLIHKCVVVAAHSDQAKPGSARTVSCERMKRAAPEELEALRRLMAHLAWEAAERRNSALTLAKDLVRSAGFFLRNLYGVLDRGQVCTLVRVMLTEMQRLNHKNELTLIHFLFDFVLLVCEHEDYVALSWPAYGEVSNLGGGLLRSHARAHPLPGMLLELVYEYVDHPEKAVRTKVITVLRKLLLMHERDARYQSTEARRRIAYLYLPLLPLAVDKADHLRQTGPDAPPYSEKRTLLACLLWVLKHVEPILLKRWWRSESHARLTRFLDVCRLCVDVFTLADEAVLVQLMGEEVDSSLDTKAMLESFYTQAVGGSPSAGRYRSLREKRADTVKKRQFRQRVDNSKQVRGYPYHAKREAHLNREANLVVLDAVEHFFVQFDAVLRRPPPNVLMENLLGELLVRQMETQQCVCFLDQLYATLRSLVARFRSVLFHPNAAYCGDIIPTVLHQCNVPARAIRGQAAAFMYLLMRCNYDEKNGNITRMKVQTTNAVAKLVSQLRDDRNLRKSLATIGLYTQSHEDGSAQDKSGLVRQVDELTAKLDTILRDSLKIQQYRDDQQMMEDLIYRVAHSYTSTPDLRVTWLDNLCDEHKKVGNYAEAACATLHIAALVAEYLYLLEPDPDSGMPDGCNAFVGVTPNVTEESLEDIISSLEEEGVCEGAQFSRRGLVKLLRRGIEQLRDAELFESAYQLFKILLPIFEASRDYGALQDAHEHISQLFAHVQEKNEAQSRMLGTYYRVAFYGKRFEEQDGKEYIYKEPKITRLSEIVQRLRTIYTKRFGKVTVLKTELAAQLADDEVAVRVSVVTPYFEAWEAKSRATHFEQNSNINQFMFETPFTKAGKAHADALCDQWKRKTILTTSHTFPYVKTRLEVVEQQVVELSPIENSIESLELQTSHLMTEVNNPVPHANSLQMRLQGSVLLQVNQGPKAICSAFLGEGADTNSFPSEQLDYLRRTFHRFLQACQEAVTLNGEVHTEEQTDYHTQLASGYRELRDFVVPCLEKADADTLLSPRGGGGGNGGSGSSGSVNANANE
jgi:dedicator of cytokinesis protein 6/7/8